MPTPITITGDSIPLPRRLVRLWRGQRVKITSQRYRLIVEAASEQSNQRERLAAWIAVRGMLKHRSLPNSVAWQRKIRQEWERAHV